MTKLIFIRSGGFKVLGVDFDGTNDYLNRGAQFTGAADSKNALFSCWFNVQGAAATRYSMFGNAGSYATGFFVSRESTNKMRWVDTQKDFSTSTSITAAGWHHWMFSFDGTNIHSYLDDVSDVSIAVNVDATLDFTHPDTDVGAIGAGGTKWDGYLAELYWYPGQYLDLSVLANRRKFITANGKPANLGVDGSTPLGSAPLVYLTARPGDSASAFATNQGSGGGMTENGALALAPSSPSD